MTTFSSASWHAAQAAWAEGEFSDEWRDLRHRMAMQGCIYPPAGTSFDSWEDDSPSQRAILIRAIRETPVLLERASRRATSWQQVIERLLRSRDDWREEMRAAERAIDPEERERYRGPAQSIAEILQRLGESVGIEQREKVE